MHAIESNWCQRVSARLCVVLLLWSVWPLSGWSQESTSIPDSSADHRVIAGATVAEWRVRMKNLDPQDPAAKDSVPGLIALVEEVGLPDFTRRQAALTLGRIGVPAAAAVPLLQQTLASAPDEETQLWVLKSLTLFGPVAAATASDLAELCEQETTRHFIRIAALEALARIGPQQPEVLPALMRGLRGTLPCTNATTRLELRVASADILSVLGPSAAPAIPDLVRLAADPSPMLRLSVTMTLGRIGPTADIAIPTLADTLLFDETPEVQDAAGVSLGQIGKPALRVLSQLATDEDPAVRQRVLLGAIAMQRPGDPLLVAFLEDSAGEIRVRAARTLIAVTAQREQALNRLFTELTCPESRVQRLAYETLRDNPKYWQQDDPRLTALLAHADSRVQRLAQRLTEAR